MVKYKQKKFPRHGRKQSGRTRARKALRTEMSRLKRQELFNTQGTITGRHSTGEE